VVEQATWRQQADGQQQHEKLSHIRSKGRVGR